MDIWIDGQGSQKSFLYRFLVGQVRGNKGRMDYDQSWELVDGLVDKSFTQWHFLLQLNCTSQCRIPFLPLNKNMELFLLLRVYTLLQQIPAQEIIRKEFDGGFGVWLRRSDHPTEGFLIFLLSPVEQLDHPIKSLGLHEVKRNVFSVAFDYGWRVVNVDVIQFLCVDPHNFEPLWLLAQSLNTCQCSLDLVSIRQHLLDKQIILLHLPFLDVLGLQFGKGIGHSTAPTGLFVFVETSHAAAFDSTAWTCVLIESGLTYVAQLFAGCMSRRDKLGGLFLIADFLSLLQLLEFGIAHQQYDYYYIYENLLDLPLLKPVYALNYPKISLFLSDDKEYETKIQSFHSIPKLFYDPSPTGGIKICLRERVIADFFLDVGSKHLTQYP